MVKTHCDHCGKIIEPHTNENKEVAINGFLGVTISVGGYSTKTDLCCCYLGKLVSTVEKFIDTADFEPEGSAKNETD
jgi:hypothetical protein